MGVDRARVERRGYRGAVYRPSSVGARYGKERGRIDDIRYKLAVMGLAAAITVAGGVVTLKSHFSAMAAERVASEVSADSMVISKEVLARDYNVFVHDIGGVDYMKLFLRRAMLGNGAMERLRQQKVEEMAGGPRAELHFVLVDKRAVTPDCLSPEQAKEMPGLQQYLQGEFAIEHSGKDKQPVSGTFHQSDEPDGVRRSYVVVAARAYPPLEKEDSRHSGSDYGWDPSNREYPLRGDDTVSVLLHEFNHFQGFGHPGADEEVRRYYDEASRGWAGREDNYFFLIVTPKATVVAWSGEAGGVGM